MFGTVLPSRLLAPVGDELSRTVRLLPEAMAYASDYYSDRNFMLQAGEVVGRQAKVPPYLSQASW